MKSMPTPDTSPPRASAVPDDPVLAELIAELTNRLEAGKPVDLEDYIGRYPEQAEPLRQLWPALRMMADLGESAVGGPSRADRPRTGDVAGPGVLGDFRLLREVGRGGMGVVYEAEQLSLGRRVALKILPMAAAMDPRQLRRFQLEAHAAACLHHTHIVPVHAVGAEHGVPFYAMQFIDGRSLAQLIAELRRLEGLDAADEPAHELADLTTSTLAASLLAGRATRSEAVSGPEAPTGEHRTEPGPPKPPGPDAPTPRDGRAPSPGSSTRDRAYIRNAARLGLEAAEALDHAHTRGILHRDIKPGNLLLDAEGRLWVTDFGLAQIQGNHGLTLSGDILGTLRYMSPEQALAKRVVIDGRTDVYSLGVTLYELLTLQPAFDGKDRAEILRKIESTEPTPLRKLNASVPQDLETIIHKALAKEPSERYATARELADDLHDYLEDRPIRARRPNLVDRATKWVRRHRASVAVASVLLILAIIGLATSTILIAREQQRTSAALDQAEFRFKLARKAVDEMYTQFAEKWLAQQPKLTPLRREFLEKALAFYEQFAADGRDDPAAQLEAARARRRVGSLHARLRKVDRAKAEFERSVEQLERLAARFPDRAEYLNELAKGLLESDAEPGIRRAVAIAESLVARYPKDPDHRETLANALRALGFHSADLKRWGEAVTLIWRSRELFEELSEEAPQNRDTRTGIAYTSRDLGIMYAGAGRFPEAEQAYKRAIDRFDTLVDESAVDLPSRYGSSMARNDFALMLANTGRLAEAIANWRRAEDLLAVLAKEFSDDPFYSSNLATTRRHLFLVLHVVGQPVEAEQVGRRWVDLADKLVSDHPGVPEHRDILIRSLHELADCYSRSPEDPFHDPQRALEISRRAAKLNPENGKSRQSLGRAQYRIGDWKGCVESLEKGPDKTADYFLAMAYWQLGDKARAHELFDRTDQWLVGYEKSWKPIALPSPAMLRGIRAEAAAILGVNLPSGEAKSRPSPRSKGQPG
jgi:serine/threonine-protein kinase